MNRKPQLVVALDVDNLKEAKRLIDALYPTVNIFKVGSQLFTAEGPQAVRMIGNKGAQVFLDLKFHDIPNTVYQSVSSSTASTVMVTSTTAGSVNKDVKEATQWSVLMMVLKLRLCWMTVLYLRLILT